MGFFKDDDTTDEFETDSQTKRELSTGFGRFDPDDEVDDDFTLTGGADEFDEEFY